MTAECQAVCQANPADPVCQPACSTQTSCALQNKTCGAIADGCGGMLDCGTCGSYLTCGGGGTANVCGAGCGAGCPSGYSCDGSRGVCKGGTPTGLVLDVKTFAIAGKVMLNGVAPTSTCMTASPATVQFYEINHGYTLSVAVPCTPDFSFSGTLYPGTYKVTVVGSANSNLPQGTAFVANPALVVAADKVGQIFDVKTVSIGGVVTLNGAPPTSTCMTASPASVLLREVTQGYSLTIAVPCSPSFAWTGNVYPGTYRVTVVGNANSNLPQGSAFVVNQALVLTSSQSALSLDVQTFAVDGKVTLNGVAPTSTCMTASPATISLQDATRGYNLTIAVPCNPTFAFTGTIYPGTYKVLVSGNANSNLPQGSAYVANQSLVVAANQTGLVLDIKTVAIDGKVTLNGAAPTSTCMTASPASISLQDITRGYNVVITVPCSPTFAFSGNIYPGTYRVSVSGNANSNLPQGTAYVANPALVVAANQTGLVLDVQTVTIAGTVTLNGAAPTSTCMTASPATVFLREVTRGYNVTITVPCNPTFAWSGTVYPGTYQVSVSGNANTNLPQGSAFVANNALAVTANLAGVVLDVKTVAVGGQITLNGSAPTSTCMTASPAMVTFTEINLGYVLTAPATCMPSFAFMGNLYPGIYRVAVAGNANSNLPQGSSYVAIERLQVP